MGSVALWHVGPSQIRDGTHASCDGGQTLPLGHQGSPLSLHSDLRTSLSISYTASLLEIPSFSFCISENDLTLPLFLKLISTEYRILGDCFFPPLNVDPLSSHLLCFQRD